MCSYQSHPHRAAMAIFVADRHLGLSGWGLGSAHQTPGHQSCWLILIAPLAPRSVALATDLPLACHCMPAWACGWTRRVGGLRGASGLRRAITGPPGSAVLIEFTADRQAEGKGPVCAWLWVVVWRHRRKPPGRLPSPNCLGVHQIPPCSPNHPQPFSLPIGPSPPAKQAAGQLSRSCA